MMAFGLGAAATSAQPCLSYPTTAGQYALAGSLAFTDGAKFYGASVNGNLTGPIAFDAGYELTDFDDTDVNGNSFGGRLAYKLPSTSLSICPFAGVTYSSVSEEAGGFEADASLLIIPIGVGVGKSFAASPNSNMMFTLSAQPSFLYVRSELTLLGEDFSDTSSEFGVALNATLGTRQFFVGAGAQFTSIEDSDPVFGVRIGLMLGGS